MAPRKGPERPVSRHRPDIRGVWGGRGFCREDQSCVAARGIWPRLLKGPRRGWGAGEEEEEVEEREEEVEAEKAEEAWWGCRVGTWSGARGAER